MAVKKETAPQPSEVLGDPDHGITDEMIANAPPKAKALLRALQAGTVGWDALSTDNIKALRSIGVKPPYVTRSQMEAQGRGGVSPEEYQALVVEGGGGVLPSPTGGGGTPIPPPPPGNAGFNSAQAQKPASSEWALMNLIKTWGLDMKDPQVQALLERGRPRKVEVPLMDATGNPVLGPNGKPQTTEVWRSGIGQAQFINEIRQTRAYKDRFAAIPADMTESQYLSTEAQYHQIAAILGIHMGDTTHPPGGRGDNPAVQGRERFLFANNVSPEEFRAKAEAVVAIRDNPAMFAQFATEIRNAGLLPGAGFTKNGNINPQHLVQFVMGLGDPAWHELWQNTLADTAAVNAGITIAQHTGLYTGLSRQSIHGLADQNLSPADMANKFNEVSDQMLATLPLSQARAYGISKSDIIEASFGGPNAAQARAKIARAQAEHQAFGSDRAAQSVGQDNQGNINVQATVTARKGYAQSEA